ncbi:hypothetical protein CBW21_05930 [Chromobacterium violaceum]|uniref:Uncharacterized protein n=2 Tax=Chromobacterium violaceum TaxID=536 RepID=A0A202BDJ0_CHRVL|nr:hypothetical protein CBW21_05930 [Chromobacterium violaceum]
MKTPLQFAEAALESINNKLILSRAAKADDLVQRMVAAGFHLRAPKHAPFRMTLGGTYHPFTIQLSYDLVDESKTRAVLTWFCMQRDGYLGTIRQGDEMVLFVLDSNISFFLYNIDQAVALDFEKERSTATADEAQP